MYVEGRKGRSPFRLGNTEYSFVNQAAEPIPPPLADQPGHAEDSSLTTGRRLLYLLRTMRPKQWTKNGFVLVGLVFDGKLLELPLAMTALWTVVCFCLVSSSVYILNDLVDIERDRHHPRKRLRPLASGRLSPSLAKSAMFVLAVAGVLGAGTTNIYVALTLVAYLLLNVVYCGTLKNLVIIDVMMIAVFFVLRVAAGSIAVEVSAFSPWLYICVSLLALFIALGKRRHEIVLLREAAAGHRTSLKQYNLPLLDQLIGVVTTSGLISYTFYSFEAETALADPSRMMLTVPLIVFVVFRYLYLIHVEQRGGAPDDLLFADRPLLAAVVLWVLSVVAVIYFP
ncbi:MAG: decaprenyl-phosphate phosphoribosyltransferase [Caldilineaceae bacterium SB0670_bin_27]|uniref:Decaprenyl-phosphate phosphoribosyltransferase n=1 Tax=Caldilineaceae bacterium SB0664_bin_27 TaxID=2605260 RepID=A0A6B0Z1W2_9CHLR|nr:decaprenyl-phosphate phosphoribosyltransferase [Caldilineaceae bacterium SB0664_bin_27]MYJ77440.1 decaprenyl-phosphate phosphoribosyltransferase [Caldilineaceae bacterium SB0670_bin_27]